MIKIANVQFWVHDQDEALAFYTKTLGWEVRADVKMEAWHFRWLAVGPVGQPEVGLVLMPVSASNMGGRGTGISTRPTSGCPAGPTTTQRKAHASITTSARTSQPSVLV